MLGLKINYEAEINRVNSESEQVTPQATPTPKVPPPK